MKRVGQLLLLSALGMAATIVMAEEPPDDDIVQQKMEEAGFKELDPLSVRFQKKILEVKAAVEEERLRRSNVAVYKVSNKVSAGSAITPESDEYYEVIKIEGRGETRYFRRDIPAEEVKRREAEASGLPQAFMAQTLRHYAAGALVTGEVLRSELQNSGPVGSLIANMGRSGSDILEGMEAGYSCETMLQVATRDETLTVSPETVSPEGIKVEVEPWTSINPMTLMTGVACMALVTADAWEAIDLDEESTQKMEDAIERAFDGVRFSGTEEVNGRLSYRLRIEDANLVESLSSARPEDGRERVGADYSLATWGYGNDAAAVSSFFLPPPNGTIPDDGDSYAAYDSEQAVFVYDADTDARNARQPLVRQVQAESSGSAGAGTVAINTIDLWIDAEYFVDRKLRMFGVMTENGESHEIFMEQQWQDYRNVPDSALYEPYKRVMRVGGMQTEAQQAELAEARAQLDELEREMASMPADQRAMMEGMMGDQIEQMRNAVNGRAVEMEIITTSIEINPDFRNPRLEQFAREAMGAPANVDPGGNLVQIIQVDLATLGYEPGNIDGILDTMTQVAISQFQAENGLQVTGEPSTELARALTAAVAER